MYHDVGINQKLLAFFSESSNYQFKRNNLKEMIDQYASYEDIRGILRNTLHKEIGESVLVKLIDYTSSYRFSGYKTFPRILKSSIVFLPEQVENLDIFARFKLFHEIGHLSDSHVEVEMLPVQTTVSLFSLIIVCIIFFQNWHTIVVIVFLAFSWYANAYFLATIASRRIGNIEKIADAFASAVLKQHVTSAEFEILKKILLIQNGFSEERWKETIKYYEQWFHNPVDMQDDFMMKRIKQYDNEELRNRLSNQSINYNSLVDRFRYPKPLIGRLLFAALIIFSGMSEVILDSSMVLVMLGVINILSIIINSINYCRFRKTSAEIEEFLGTKDQSMRVSN